MLTSIPSYFHNNTLLIVPFFPSTGKNHNHVNKGQNKVGCPAIYLLEQFLKQDKVETTSLETLEISYLINYWIILNAHGTSQQVLRSHAQHLHQHVATDSLNPVLAVCCPHSIHFLQRPVSLPSSTSVVKGQEESCS